MTRSHLLLRETQMYPQILCKYHDIENIQVLSMDRKILCNAMVQYILITYVMINFKQVHSYSHIMPTKKTNTCFIFWLSFHSLRSIVHNLKNIIRNIRIYSFQYFQCLPLQANTGSIDIWPWNKKIFNNTCFRFQKLYQLSHQTNFVASSILQSREISIFWTLCLSF